MDRWEGAIGSFFSTSNVATLLAGLGGASLGGVISYATARKTSNEVFKRDDVERQEEEHARAVTCLVSTMQIANRIYTITLALKDVSNPPGGFEPWQIVKTHTGENETNVAYDAKDFTAFVNAGTAEVINRCFLLSERCGSLEKSFIRYNELRDEMERFLLPFSTFNHGHVTTAIPTAARNEYRYRSHNLNNLLVSMHSYASNDLKEAKSLIKLMNNTIAKRFSDRNHLQLKVDTHLKTKN